MTTNNNGPVIYGLLQSILSKESEEKPVENEIIKK